jgi:integrase
MGKDLRGRELGVGISQRKDGLYTARFIDKRGNRIQKYFRKLQECKNWYADSLFRDENTGLEASGNMSVTAWFNYWITEIKGDNIKPNTIKIYTQCYESNIKKYIGKMLLNDVKPMHCQNILNQMSSSYSISTIKLTRNIMHSFFECALENDLIVRSPIKKNVKCMTGRESKQRRVLSIHEQSLFLEAVKNSSNYNQWALLLQTGLRTGEMIGLKWSDIDFTKKILHVQRTMDYKNSDGKWQVGEPKSKSGHRDVPLTQEAIKILKDQKDKINRIKIIPIEYSDMVFLSSDGKPKTNTAYDSMLYRYCSNMGIERFSMHTLRHTFATRCIEAGMKPKTLQMILGHSNIGLTMNLYVHVTEDEKVKEIESVETALKLV